MKLYKKSFKGIALAAFSVLALSACSDWTDSESIKLKETDSIKKLMKNMNLTIDQTMNALEVPADKREKYRKTITPDN